MRHPYYNKWSHNHARTPIGMMYHQKYPPANNQNIKIRPSAGIAATRNIPGTLFVLKTDSTLITDPTLMEIEHPSSAAASSTWKADHIYYKYDNPADAKIKQQLSFKFDQFPLYRNDGVLAVLYAYFGSLMWVTTAFPDDLTTLIYGINEPTKSGSITFPVRCSYEGYQANGDGPTLGKINESSENNYYDYYVRFYSSSNKYGFMTGPYITRSGATENCYGNWGVLTDWSLTDISDDT